MKKTTKIIPFPSYAKLQSVLRNLTPSAAREVRSFAKQMGISPELLVDQAVEAFAADMKIGETLLGIARQITETANKKRGLGFRSTPVAMAADNWRERIQSELEILKRGNLDDLWLFRRRSLKRLSRA